MKARTGLATVLTLAASAAQAITPCDRLVAYVRGLPPSAWAAGDQALAPALVFEPDRTSDAEGRPVKGFERRLAALPEVLEALGVDDDGTLRVEHLSGTDLYAVTSVQGTLHCSSSVFVRTRDGKDNEIVPGPKSLSGDDNDICWTTAEGLARAFDMPVHAVHDLVGPTATTADFTLTSWTGSRWGAVCRATLTFRAAYTLTDHFCGDPSVCESGAKVARDVAIAYNQLRESDARADTFAFGPPAPADIAAKIAAVKLAPAGGDFPTFGGAGGNQLGYGGAGHILFPLQLGDHWYAAAVGHGGVGWREDNTTLLAVFDLADKTLTPLAGFVVTRSLAGLDSAKITPLKGPS
jgi:hypothetical protein